MAHLIAGKQEYHDLQSQIVSLILKHYPDVQAIYLFGSFNTPNERSDSDIDLALLLPPAQAMSIGSLASSELWNALENHLHRSVDLVNLRKAPVVFQNEIVMAGRLLYGACQYAVDEFEMLVLSFYQKLNEERAGILADGLRSGKFYDL